MRQCAQVRQDVYFFMTPLTFYEKNVSGSLRDLQQPPAVPALLASL
jgi:hypothetical protein